MATNKDSEDTDLASARSQLTREIDAALDSVGTDHELNEFSRLAAAQNAPDNNHRPGESIDRQSHWADRESEFRRTLLADIESVDAAEAQTILTAADQVTDLTVLRADSTLIMLRDDGTDRYPAFQFDRQHHNLVAVVAYANKRIGAASDPWGAADWWRTPSRVLDDRTPMNALTTGELTRTHIDLIGKHELA